MNKCKELEEDCLKEIMFKEIDIIQSVISRMASNSFLIKGWTVTLVVGSLVLKNENSYVIALIPIVVFWILDAFFLRQERLFRKLYIWVIGNRLKSEDYLFNMDTSRFNSEVDGILLTMFSKTLLLFYGSQLALVLFLIFKNSFFFCY